VKESLLVVLKLKRIAQTRFFLALFAAVLGLCVNCKADSLSVYAQFNDAQYSSHTLVLRTDPGSSSGLVIAAVPAADDYTFLRQISVPAIPTGAVVTSATFSLTAGAGSSLVVPGVVAGRIEAQLGFIGALSLDPPYPYDVPSSPCTPPDCAPTIATVSVDYGLGLGPNCVDFGLACFTAPVTGSFDLLSLGISPSYFADGFNVENDGPADYLFCCANYSIDEVLYPGFNSETHYSISGIGPQLSESVVVDYALPTTVPEPSTLPLLVPGLLALAVFRLKRATALVA